MNKKKIILAAILLSLISVVFYLNFAGYFQLERLREFIEGFGMWGIVVYMLIYMVVILTNLPASVFTILAGLLFGVWQSLIAVVIAATISATIAFYIGRFLFSSTDFRNRKAREIIKKIEKNAEKNGFTAIAVLRLSFLPYMPLSYAAGLVKNLKAKDFVLATALTNIFGSFVFIFLGASLEESLPLFVFAIILVILFSQTPKVIKKFRK